MPKKRKTPNYPSITTGSITEKAAKDLPYTWLTLPLFGHWFATELYNVHHTVANTNNEGDTISVGSTSLQKALLEEVSSKLKTACLSVTDKRNLQGRGFMSNFALRQCEIGWTGVCSAHLASLFHSLKGTFVHQAPTSYKTGIPCTVDWYFAKSDRAGLMLDPILCGDGKLHSIGAAKRTTVYHCQNCVVIRHQNNDWPIMLGLSSTPTEACVFISFPTEEAMWQVEIIESSPLWNKALLFTLYYGLQTLLVGNVTTSIPLSCNQPKRFPLTPLKTGDKDQISVFKEGERVTKYYDSNYKLKQPNLAIVEKYSDLEDVKLHYITLDHRIQCLSYKYVEGNHDPTSITQFVDVLDTLNKLHDNNIVHSDVRLANIVFTAEKTYLIDFDLAEGVGEDYPAGYAILEERHPAARALSPREKCHDRYSLWYIIHVCLNVDLDDLLSEEISLCQIIETMNQ